MRGTFAVLTGLAVAAVIVTAQQRSAESDMAAAAQALIASLDKAQLAKVRWPFDSEERFKWYFVPRDREGLPWAAMNARQREAAVALLRTGLSAAGYKKWEGVRTLEGVLREIEQSARRDPERYYFTIFGEPGSKAWAWRYEGHHIAQNWTIIGGKATATTPAFFGANPAEVRDGPHKGLRVLAAEEDLARALVSSLTPEQSRAARIADVAPADIVTGNSRRAAPIDGAGVSAAALTEAQRTALMRLIEEHASAQAPGLAEQRMRKVRGEDPSDVRFAWAGPVARAPGNGHYYRVQGRTFLIEYDNTQDAGNHQHVVWRDFAGDFGEDLLAGHYASSPHHAGARAAARHDHAAAPGAGRR